MSFQKLVPYAVVTLAKKDYWVAQPIVEFKTYKWLDQVFTFSHMPGLYAHTTYQEPTTTLNFLNLFSCISKLQIKEEKKNYSVLRDLSCYWLGLSALIFL